MTVEMGAALAKHFGVRAGWLVYNEGEPHPDTATAYQNGHRDALRHAAGLIRVMEALAVTPDAATSDLIEQVARAVKAEAGAKGGKKKRAGRKTA
jgi:hypothetical protein